MRSSFQRFAAACGWATLGTVLTGAESGETEVPKVASTPPISAPASPGVTIEQRVQADVEGLYSSDIQLTQATVGYTQKRRRFEGSVSVSYSSYELDYQPASFDFLGLPTHLSERRISGQLSGKVPVSDSLQLLVSGGAYDGYADYRSIWLNEYYRQQYAGLTGPGDAYVTPSPAGQNFNVGFRWEYLPTTGFIQGDYTYAHDVIAPGYEIDFEGLRRGRTDLYTGAYHISFENVLTRRLRLLNEFRLTDTTNRKLRYNYQGSLNYALADHWVARGYGGYTEEDPQFQAHYVGATIEFEPITGWLISAAGRYYRDTGEIENSLFSSAAPGLEAWQVGLGVRHVWGNQSVKVYAAPYFTRYDPAGIGTAFFENLYRNRTWVAVQAAYTLEF